MYPSHPHKKERNPLIPRPLYMFLCLLYLLSSVTICAHAKTYVLTDGNYAFTYDTDKSGSEKNDPVSMPEVLLQLYGQDSRIPTSAQTVEQFLQQRNLQLHSQDILSLPLDTPISDGLKLQIDSVITQQESYSVTIPHEVSCCSDSSLPVGTEEVLIPGKDGELLCTAEVTYINGIEQSREILTQTQTIAPVTELIAKGTGSTPEPEVLPDMPIIEDGYIIMPTGEIVTYYKTDYVTATGYTHTDAGCDMITSTGTTVHYGTAAVDPRFIPYGTRMLIVSHDGERYYGIATAEDCGGAIKRDRMDLYFPTYQECIDFGRRRCTIYFLG